MNFSYGGHQPWSVPAKGWYWDGIHFRHFVDSPDQELLCLCIFSEVGPHGGGTLVAEGSHKLVAKFLEKHPEGLESQHAIDTLNLEHPWLKELTSAVGGDKDDFLGIGDASPEARIERFMNWHTDEDGVRLRVIETTSSPGEVTSFCAIRSCTILLRKIIPAYRALCATARRRFPSACS